MQLLLLTYGSYLRLLLNVVLLRVEFGALTHSECLLLLLFVVNWLLFQLFLGLLLLLAYDLCVGCCCCGLVAQLARLGAAELFNEMELCLCLKSEFAVDDDDSVKITSL